MDFNLLREIFRFPKTAIGEGTLYIELSNELIFSVPTVTSSPVQTQPSGSQIVFIDKPSPITANGN